MLGTSTHDTKRSEDSRARLAVLSELPGQWRLTPAPLEPAQPQPAQRQSPARRRPSRGDEYHFYQALIAVWPGGSMAELRDRLKAYMLKAVREAKQHSSWINPDLEYEAALERFVVESLQNELFLKDLKEAMPRLAHLGMLAGLSQALLKVASPGVPDYYQGSELWDFSLVDPDKPAAGRFRAEGKASWRKIQSGRRRSQAARHPARTGSAQEIFRSSSTARANTPHYADGGMEERICAFFPPGRQSLHRCTCPATVFFLDERGRRFTPVGEKDMGGIPSRPSAGRLHRGHDG